VRHPTASGSQRAFAALLESIHQQDVDPGLSRVYLPNAMGQKYPGRSANGAGQSRRMCWALPWLATPHLSLFGIEAVVGWWVDELRPFCSLTLLRVRLQSAV